MLIERLLLLLLWTAQYDILYLVFGVELSSEHLACVRVGKSKGGNTRSGR